MMVLHHVDCIANQPGKHFSYVSERIPNVCVVFCNALERIVIWFLCNLIDFHEISKNFRNTHVRILLAASSGRPTLLPLL